MYLNTHLNVYNQNHTPMSTTEYESIITKARKVAELAEKGIDGEAESAKRRLSDIMSKYGLSLEDIGIEATRDYDFSVRNSDEEILFRQIVKVVCNSSQIRTGSYRRGKKHVRWATLTPYQFAEVSEMLSFHMRQFRKEMKAMKHTFLSAYANKHRLFPKDHENKTEMTEEEWLKLHSMMNQLDDTIQFRKALHN